MLTRESMSIPHVVLGSVRLTGTALGIELEFQTNLSHQEYLAGGTPPTHCFILSALDVHAIERQINEAVLAHQIEIEAKWQEERESCESNSDE